MWIRFRREKDQPPQPTWDNWTLNYDKIEKGYQKLDNSEDNLYDYMFPTSHDIFPEILDECIIVLRKVLDAGNSVLITTKPHLDCIKRICTELMEWRGQICFRFTITSISDATLIKYEPHAPLTTERHLAVKKAHNEGFKTSLSIEPFLDKNPLRIIDLYSSLISDTIWVGIMSGSVLDDDLKQEYETEIKPNYTEEKLQKILENLGNLPQETMDKVRLKDSIVNKLNLSSNKLQHSSNKATNNKNNKTEGLNQWLTT
jgi:DNA repair photolyase